MKSKPCKILEDGRRVNGPWTSPAGQMTGSFLVPSPVKTYHLKIIASNDGGWEHVSVSILPQNRRPMRCPTWEEMCYVKDLFWEDEEGVIQYHPPKSEHVNIHNYVLHLWRPVEATIPLPPKVMV